MNILHCIFSSLAINLQFDLRYILGDDSLLNCMICIRKTVCMLDPKIILWEAKILGVISYSTDWSDNNLRGPDLLRYTGDKCMRNRVRVFLGAVGLMTATSGFPSTFPGMLNTS